jgi:hypothetical protein
VSSFGTAPRDSPSNCLSSCANVSTDA